MCNNCKFCSKALTPLTKTSDWNGRVLHLKCYKNINKGISYLTKKYKHESDETYYIAKHAYFKNKYNFEF